MTTEIDRQSHEDRLTRALAHWTDVKTRLEREIADLEVQLQKARDKVTHCAEAISICDELDMKTIPKYGIHSHIDPAELKNCVTQRAAALKVAELTEGRLKLSDASRLIFATGMSSAKGFTGVKSSIYGMVSESPDWEKDDDDVYHLLTFRKPIPCRDLVKEGREEQKKAMREWFFKHFEDPAHNMPHDSREGYIYITSGPHDAEEELRDQFENSVSEDVFKELASELSDQAFEWARRYE